MPISTAPIPGRTVLVTPITHVLGRVPAFVLLILLATCGIPVRATDTDSLRAVLHGTLPDTTRIKLLMELGGELADRGEFEEADQRLSEALERVQRLGDQGLECKVLNGLGIAHFYRGDNLAALKYWERAAAIAQARKDEGYHRKIRMNMANAWMAMGQYPLAQRAYYDALRWAEANGKEQEVINGRINIAVLYGMQERYDSMRTHLERVLKEYGHVMEPFTKANVLNNLSSVDEREGRTDDVEQHAQAMLALSRQAGLSRFIGISHELLGLVAMHRFQRDTSRTWFKEAIRIHAAEANDRDKASAMQRLAELDLDAVENGDKGYVDRFFHGDRTAALAEAQTLIDSVIILFREQEEADQLRNAYESLSRVARAQGDHRAALEHYVRFKQLSDSLLNAERDKRLTERAMEYAFEQKEATARAEQERKDQRQRLVRNGIAGGLCLALLFLGVVWRQRNRINAEKERSEELLLNILPEEVAEELKEKGHADAKHFDTATILFTDFKGFTQLSEQVTPAELVEELNSCFKAFDGIMGRYRIEKIKTIGDAYMAAGGLPDPEHGSPADVVRAALEMQAFMVGHKAERVAAGKPFFEMRVGIHTGPVVAGIVGVKKFQYDIWGDTVNTASRMESSGEVGQVNISEATYGLVKSEQGFTFTPRGKVQAKGKGEMEMYFVQYTR